MMMERVGFGAVSPIARLEQLASASLALFAAEWASSWVNLGHEILPGALFANSDPPARLARLGRSDFHARTREMADLLARVAGGREGVLALAQR